ncbi:cytochrome P450 [Methanosarcina siciliae]|nr:cytochrome P450 [Methanosarcina siciliae]
MCTITILTLPLHRKPSIWGKDYGLGILIPPIFIWALT